MEDSAMLFSLLYFIAFILELGFGAAIMYMNPKGKLNRQVFLSSISLSFWSLGFVMSNSAETKEICLFWRRFSAIGWTTAYAVLLHLLLILTKKDNILKRIHYVLLYLPALICLYIFAISSSISIGQYNLLKGVHGWVNVSVNNGWDFFFYIYYIGYVIMGLLLLISWKRNTEDKAKLSQAKIMIASIIAIGVLGTLTDIILNKLLVNPIPQMAPIFNLIPVISILYTTKKNSYMKERIENKDDLILTATTQVELYFYFAFLFLAGGAITSSVYFMGGLSSNNGSIQYTVFFSLFLYLIGILIILFQFIEIEKIRNTLVIGITLLSIPLITLSFLEYGAITVWVFPVILMILSLVFNSQVVLFSIAAVSIFTQLLVFLNVPTNIIKIDRFDYFLRMGIFIMVYGIGAFVNKLYLNRLKDNMEKVKSQKLISEISYEFVAVSERNIEGKVINLLKDIGEYFSIDRCYIFMINSEDNTISNNYEWCNEGISSNIERIQGISLDANLKK